jgi:hypothetical protein
MSLFKTYLVLLVSLLPKPLLYSLLLLTVLPQLLQSRRVQGLLQRRLANGPREKHLLHCLSSSGEGLVSLGRGRTDTEAEMNGFSPRGRQAARDDRVYVGRAEGGNQAAQDREKAFNVRGVVERKAGGSGGRSG